MTDNNYLIESTKGQTEKVSKRNSPAGQMVIFLALFMGSSFLAGLAWDVFPYFTIFPVLVALLSVNLSRS